MVRVRAVPTSCGYRKGITPEGKTFSWWTWLREIIFLNKMNLGWGGGRGGKKKREGESQTIRTLKN